MTSRPWRIVDAFASEPFAGNPAAILLLEADDELSDDLQQQIAAEANLSETAFVRPRDDGRWDLRWFTPTAEVDLCGHATLAAGHVLLDEFRRGLDVGPDGEVLDHQEVVFVTRSGTLRAVKGKDGIIIDLPAVLAVPEWDADLREAVGTALGAQPVELLGTEHDPHEDRNLVAVYADAATVRSLQPDMAEVAKLAGGVIATAPADDPDVDIVSRYFTPQYGIPEDPVTGSAHCTLGPYWCQRLGKGILQAAQVSARGGRLGVRPWNDRVFLSGQAVTVVTGELRLP